MILEVCRKKSTKNHFFLLSKICLFFFKRVLIRMTNIKKLEKINIKKKYD